MCRSYSKQSGVNAPRRSRISPWSDARNESIQPALVFARLPENEATLSETPAAPRIPIVALTSCVCAFGAAGLRRGLQGSFTRVGGIGLHMWLLVMMVRI